MYSRGEGPKLRYVIYGWLRSKYVRNWKKVPGNHTYGTGTQSFALQNYHIIEQNFEKIAIIGEISSFAWEEIQNFAFCTLQKNNMKFCTCLLRSLSIILLSWWFSRSNELGFETCQISVWHFLPGLFDSKYPTEHDKEHIFFSCYSTKMNCFSFLFIGSANDRFANGSSNRRADKIIVRCRSSNVSHPWLSNRIGSSSKKLKRRSLERWTCQNSLNPLTCKLQFINFL